MINIVNRCQEIYIKYLKKWLPLICITYWVVFSFFNYNMSSYFFDETWAWNIASDLSFVEIIKLMHHEGHTFLWFLVLKPFTYFPNLYPDILKYINWTISFVMMIAFWKFTPLNDLIKVLVTLSTPFLILYPTYARPYSMTILFLLILVLLFKERLNRPLVYSIVTFLAMNSCLNGAIFAGMLSLFFLYDVIKGIREPENDKKYIVPIIITILSYLSLVAQWIPFCIPHYTEYFDKFLLLNNFFFNQNFPYNFLAFIVFFPLLQLVLYSITAHLKDKRWSFLSFIIINFMIFFFMFIYIGQDQHLYFIYIYFILIYILLLENCEEFKSKKLVYNSFTLFIISVSLLFNHNIRFLNREDLYFVHKNTILKAVQKIKENVPNGTDIYIHSTTNELIPYLKKDYNLINIYGENMSTYSAYEHTHMKEDVTKTKNIKLIPAFVIKIKYLDERLDVFNRTVIDGTYILKY